jgi:hypothetical protein
MDIEQDSFRAWFETDNDGRSKIVVLGEVAQHEDDQTMLVRAKPQGINPRILMLKIAIKRGSGTFRAHNIMLHQKIRYEEPAAKGDFSDVHIQSSEGNFTIMVAAATPSP